MMIDLKKLLSALGLNVGLITVFAAVLGLFGIDLNLILSIAGSMVGMQLLISLCVNVLKWSGVVKDDTAGYWSAGLNLAGLGVIAVTIGVNPAFDFTGLDAQLVTIANFGVLIFGYIVQVAGTKYMHQAVAYGLGVKKFSYSLRQLSHFSA